MGNPTTAPDRDRHGSKGAHGVAPAKEGLPREWEPGTVESLDDEGLGPGNTGPEASSFPCRAPCRPAGGGHNGAMGPTRTASPHAAPLAPGAGPSSAFCPMHRRGVCRSCPHQDEPLDLQLAAKQDRVAAVLSDRVPPQAWQPPVASAPSRLRNKAKMVVSGTAANPVLGILGPRGTGVDLRGCPLHTEAIEQALPALARAVTALGLAPYDVAARRGELKHLIVTSSPDGDLMVRWVLRSDRHVPDLRRHLPRLRRDLPTLAVMSANIQPVHQAVLEGPEEILITHGPGQDMLLMRLTLPGPRELPLLLPTRSFFQTNTAVAQALYATAAQWAHRVRGRVWDLFCGVGGFALALAGPRRQVLGVEVSESAVRGARRARALMGLTRDQVRFEPGDAHVLDPGAGAVPDLLVVNPPRRGIGDLAQRLEAAGVPRVLYSSCNPASLARDLERLPSLRVRRARLFDMFPHTDHAEVLVELER